MTRLLSLFVTAACLLQAQDPAAEFFEMKVRPLLAKNCFACHTQSKMGGLSLSPRVRKSSKAATPAPPSKRVIPIKASSFKPSAKRTRS